MTTAAVIVGIDNYESNPLTSAVNDAVEFKDTLLAHKIIDSAQDVVMLTSPSAPGRLEPTRDKIIDTLYGFYKNGDQLERFVFFFAGHGLLTFSDAARARTRTVLVPADVRDLDSQGNRLIDLSEVLDYMRRAGPQEQFFIIDACRNLAWERHPNVGVTGWGQPRTFGNERAQATLYAVSELGVALGVQNGMGVMTTHLVKALEGDGVAKVFDDSSDSWVVTTQSTRDYVKKAIRTALRSPPNFMLPQLDAPDPQLSPIRTIQDISDEPLVININPDESATDTSVAIKFRSLLQSNFCLPPRKNHEKLLLPPHWYRIEASHPYVTPVPPWRTVDLREEHKVDFLIPISGMPSPPKPPSSPPPETVPPTVNVYSPVSEGVRLGFRDANNGRVTATALEPQVAIELESLQPPYKSWLGYGKLDEVVPVGPYRVRFRLGRDVFNESDLYVQNEDVKISATAAITPLLREALSIQDEAQNAAVISESIGSIQAGLLQTLLPIVGIKPFDIADELFHRFSGLIKIRTPEDFGMRPLSVVVAFDGDDWGEAAAEMIEQARCEVVDTSKPNSMTSIGFEPVANTKLAFDSTAGAGGLERIGLAVTAAPSNSFELLIKLPFRDIRLFSSAIGNRATVVTIALRPNGSVDVSQNILRLPGRNDLYKDEQAPDVPYGRMLRELQLGQQLFKSNELITERFRLTVPYLIQDLFYAKWTDPIMSCMAFYAWDEYSRQHAAKRAPFEQDLVRRTAENLHRYFGELPDSHIVYGLSNENARDFEFKYLLSENQVPLLTSGARHLSGFAKEHGLADHTISRYVQRLDVDQPWTLIFEAQSSRTEKVESENEHSEYPQS